MVAMLDDLRDLFIKLEEIGERFAGYSIDRRRSIPLPTGWTGRIRIQIFTSKDSRAEYRITEYGTSFEAVAVAVIARVAALDAAARVPGWTGKCAAGLHGLDYNGQACDLCPGGKS